MQTTYWCFVASAPQKPQVNNFIEVFVYNGDKYGFWFIMYNGFVFSKSYFFAFYFSPHQKTYFLLILTEKFLKA